MSRAGYFLIADISGYTEFVAGTELEHAQGIMSSLLTTLVEAIAPPMQLAKFEGDAVFCAAPAAGVRRAQTILDGIDDLYCRFAGALERIRRNTTCPCQACRKAGDLNLKFVLHHGEYAEQSIAGRTELAGTPIIIVHRLMKNRIREATGIAAYLYVTEAAARALDAVKVFDGKTRHSETIDGIGRVEGWVVDMAPIWAERRERERLWVAPGAALWFPALGGTLPISPATMWSYLLDPAQRLRWIDGMTGMSVDGRADGKLDRGAVMHCAHGKEKLDFEVVDWRPFETVSTDLNVPMGGLVRTTFELKETPGGVHMEARLQLVRCGTGPLSRLIAKPLLSMVAGKVEKSFKKSVATLAKIVEDDIAAGKTERWQPVAKAPAF
jgi:hypothetical protein